ncbi:MAG: pseudouridine-5-phosphate glycosidase [spirochete symbiont of Stewartia floridana]|nr:MAG: pseudouridine-5-phosphate glycosidase [spirochete symbiont of Stewartia floridana]
MLQFNPEVTDAQASGKPILVLESTIIAHGMPYPDNVEMALRVQDIVRSQGAVPATVAIIAGHPTIGLTNGQIEQFGKMGNQVAKASRRDIPLLAAAGENGATTVAGTMIIAAMAGIRVFTTGGIGGVHRGASESFDISADLEELARTEVAVVCAGVKSILDIGLTLEYLETKGVPVLGYRTDKLPAFYTTDSGFGVDRRMDAPEEIAKVMYAQWTMVPGGGLLVSQPVSEDHSMDRQEINTAIDDAVKEADAQGITGKAVTPFILARVADLTGGKSLKSNIALVENNARLGACIAAAYNRLINDRKNQEQ